MKAIRKYYLSRPCLVIIHNDVVEIEKTHGLNREFRCQCCGVEWIESINSPQILSEDVENNFGEYYKYCECFECKKLRKINSI